MVDVAEAMIGAEHVTLRGCSRCIALPDMWISQCRCGSDLELAGRRWRLCDGEKNKDFGGRNALDSG
jgi:hypothetical protein